MILPQELSETPPDMFSSVCRICLQDGEMFSLYDKLEGAELTFSDKIMQITQISLVSSRISRKQTKQLFNFKDKKNPALPQHICASCIADLDASYRFRMNCESSDAILQNYFTSSDTPDAVTEASEAEEEIITESEAEPELPIDESDLYNYQSQMYEENNEMICEEDNLENALDVSF